jgi:hypothetical protein
LAAQAVEVIVEDGGARLFAPVTSRGEAVGVLELGLEDFRVSRRWPMWLWRRTSWRTW